MPMFRTKPVIKEAHRFMGPFSVDEMPDDFRKAIIFGRYGLVTIKTLEGAHSVTPGDWIIRGVAGEFYPCKHEIFEQTYEPAPEAVKEPNG